MSRIKELKQGYAELLKGISKGKDVYVFVGGKFYHSWKPEEVQLLKEKAEKSVIIRQKIRFTAMYTIIYLSIFLFIYYTFLR